MGVIEHGCRACIYCVRIIILIWYSNSSSRLVGLYRIGIFANKRIRKTGKRNTKKFGMELNILVKCPKTKKHARIIQCPKCDYYGGVRGGRPIIDKVFCNWSTK
jgi:hypothetical protein